MEDAGDKKVQLVTDSEDSSQALINLIVTGQAVLYIHNNEILYDEDDKLLVTLQTSTVILLIKTQL